MKRIERVLRRIRGWAQGFVDAIQASNLEPRQHGTEHEETMVILTPWHRRSSGYDGKRTTAQECEYDNDPHNQTSSNLFSQPLFIDEDRVTR